MDHGVTYERPLKKMLLERIYRKVQTRRIIMFWGGRQSGKTTLIHQALASYEGPSQYLNFDKYDDEEALEQFPELEKYDPKSRKKQWMFWHWERARKLGKESEHPFVLALDEFQHLEKWAQKVKGRWDDDYWHSNNVQVILLGSSPHLLQKGLSESLLGRFVFVDSPHWSFLEMSTAFGLSLDEYLFYGGYPGAVQDLRGSGGKKEWRRYVRHSVVESNLNRDVFDLITIDEPEVLRKLYNLGARSSGQIFSFGKISKTLQGGSQKIFLRYLEILKKVFMLTSLPNYTKGGCVELSAGKAKFQVFNNALLTIEHRYSLQEAKEDPEHWGQVIESAVGAHLLNTKDATEDVFHWREDDDLEVDFVVTHGSKVIAIEVKSGPFKGKRRPHRGLEAFKEKFSECTHTYLVGEGGDVTVKEFLSQPVSYWCEKARLV